MIQEHMYRCMKWLTCQLLKLLHVSVLYVVIKIIKSMTCSEFNVSSDHIDYDIIDVAPPDLHVKGIYIMYA